MEETPNSIVCRSIGNNDLFYHLYGTSKFSDVVFELGTTKVKKIYAHKLVLALASEYFESIFYTRRTEDIVTVPIKDMEQKDFDILMKFIYMYEFSVKSTDIAIIIAKAAKRFAINELFVLCINFIELNMSVMNVWEAYDLGRKYQLESLLKKVSIFIKNEQRAVFNLPPFLLCDKDILLSVVKDIGRSLNQKALFYDLTIWATKLGSKDAKAMRAVLMPFLPHVLFHSLSPEEFTLAMAASDIFSDEEFTSISLYIVGFTDRLLPSWCNVDPPEVSMMKFGKGLKSRRLFKPVKK